MKRRNFIQRGLTWLSALWAVLSAPLISLSGKQASKSVATFRDAEDLIEKVVRGIQVKPKDYSHLSFVRLEPPIDPPPREYWAVYNWIGKGKVPPGGHWDVAIRFNLEKIRWMLDKKGSSTTTLHILFEHERLLPGRTIHAEWREKSCERFD